MPTQIVNAKRGNYTEEMKFVANSENIDVEFLRKQIAQGRAVILKNSTKNSSKPTGIGEGLRTKICSIVGTTNTTDSLDIQADKARIVQEAGADFILDLSMGDLVNEARQTIINAVKLPVGTNPFYQSAIDIIEKAQDLTSLSKEKILSDIEKQCADGVDLVSLNCALTKSVLEQLKTDDSISNLSSRGAILLGCYMELTQKENPLFEYFDEIIKIIKEYDAVLSISSSIKAGSILNNITKSQYEEFIVMGNLAKIARQNGVQVMIDGIGHTSINKIPTAIKALKELTSNAPLFTRNLLVCDNATGYSHISSAIGSAIACQNGANALLATTSFNDLYNPTVAQIKEGIVSAKIAAHCADVIHNQKELELEKEFSFAKRTDDIENQAKYSLDKDIASEILTQKNKQKNNYDKNFFDDLIKKCIK